MRLHNEDCYEPPPWWPEVLVNHDLVDFIHPKEIYIWFAFVPNGGDLELERVSDDEDGLWPEWLTFEVEQAGWDFIDTHNKWGDRFGGNAVWALEHGIAPYQPFRVHCLEPRYYRSGGYEYPEEWDVEWDWDVNRIIPISDWDTIRRWEYYFMENAQHHEAVAHERAYWDNQHRTQIKAMKIVSDMYWADGYYDDMTPPNGLMLKLRSDLWDRFGRNHWRDLITVREDSGDYEKAREKLRARIAEELPHVNFDDLNQRRVWR
jgi:hypothetical protein